MSAENILGIAFAALLNSLWQSAAMALFIWAALRFLPRINARINAATRCAVWWAVLAAVVLLPMASPSRTDVEAPPPMPQVAPQGAPRVPSVQAPAAEPAALSEIETPQTSSRAYGDAGPLQMTAGAGLIAIFAIWAALSLLRIAQIVRSYRYLRGIKQRSRGVSAEQLVNFDYWLLACGIDRTARLLVSSEIASPMAVGFRRPAVIVPETLMNEFTAEELDHVILHELAHIARYDDWTNLFARLTGALLPVHPVAIWLLQRIDQDREIACDDWVVAMTGEARPYAASLTRLFELCSARRRQLLATGMADRSSHLGERIEALLRAGREFAPRVSLMRVALSAAILLGLVLAGAQAPHWVAFAQEPTFAQEPAATPLLPVAPVPPVPPVPPVAPVPQVPPVLVIPPVAPVAPLPPSELPREFQARQQELQNALEQLRETQRQFAEQNRAGNGAAESELRKLADQIRATEAQVRARKAEVSGVADQIRAEQAQLLAQQTQVRAERANRGPNGSFLAALVAAGYGDLPVDAIIEMHNAGVSADFLRSIAEAGWGKLPPKDLIALAHSGVSAQYLRALRDAGFKNLSVQEAIDIAHEGLRPDLIRALKDAFPQITMREIIEAAHSGLNPDDLRQAREYGPNLTLEQIIRLKHAGVI